jgi:Flp pilus assembly protein TadB
MIPAGSLPAAIAGAATIALLVPGRPGPRRLVTRQGLFSDRWSLPAKLRGKDVPPATRRLHRAVAVIAAGALLLMFGLPWGLLLAVVAVLAMPIGLSRFEPAATRQRSARVVADLPLAVDLLAACLRAGRPPDEAVGTVGKALGGPLADQLAEVERRLSLGADPIAAWGCLLDEPACASFARAVQRALRSGAPLAKTLEHLADDVRQGRRWSAEEQARAVETRAVVPLGLCFLPAFVLIGIVPTIASSFSGILTLVGG